ncbi:TPA: hypothetical protein N0F65_002276 [Lagenidium giganteum]|uniref:tRNA:m(4)X modification enzyme TRM13 n=1 Tax=Lagenidium giganteum TaxID=4803 RepID=A0AAV2YKY6_9STRA|nr:TPA: hypothetical protein N0F65_002276 [Lagenidium giganteum]
MPAHLSPSSTVAMEVMDERKRSPAAAAGAQDGDQKEMQRKRRKQEKTKATLDGEWDRCMFKILRKNRFCNLERVNGAMYCGNHLPDDVLVASKKSQRFKEELRKRVPCPVDGSHTVYQYDLDKHVLVCNKLKEANAMKMLPYYSENINSGNNAHAVDHPEASSQQLATADEEDNATDEHKVPDSQQQQSLLDRLGASDFVDLTRRIHAAYDSCVGTIPLEKLTHQACDQLMQDKKDAGTSQSLLRHIEQQASILGHMDKLKLLDESATYVELGAGRGMLSLALAQSYPSNVYVLIDRAHTRGKADSNFESSEGDGTRNAVRAKIDIRHLNFAGMPEVVDKPVVCMSKHLCGVATDLSLRAVVQTLPSPAASASESSDHVSPNFRGLAVALCCHQVCAWEDYVAPEFFTQLGFQPEEFDLLRSMTSWATCGMGLGGDAVERVLGISQVDRAVLGRQCKRILDAGRAAYLRSFGLETRLVHYCDVQDSLENCLLLAWHPTSTS